MVGRKRGADHRKVKDDEKEAKGFSRTPNAASKAKEIAEPVARIHRPRSTRPQASYTLPSDLSDADLMQIELAQDMKDEVDDDSSEPKRRKPGRKPKSATSPTPPEIDSTEPLVKNGTVFNEPALRNDKIVTGQPLDEPPNIYAKRELNALTKKRRGKHWKTTNAANNNKSPSPSVDDTDEETGSLNEKALKLYSKGLTNLSKIEKSTKLSKERSKIKNGKVNKRNGTKEEMIDEEDIHSYDAVQRQALKSPVKKPKHHRRVVDLSAPITDKKDDDDDSNEAKSIEGKPKELQTSEPSTSSILNQDFCYCCGLPGMFLCCETCPKSFHFHCLDPPMDPNKLPDRWSCKECLGKNSIQTPNVGIMGKMLTNIEFQNPVAFKLPREIVESFQGILMDQVGDYEDDSFKEEKTYKQLVSELDDPTSGVLDSNGNPYLCFKCNMSSKKGQTSEIISCDYCPLSWHLDCLDPPMAYVKKLGSKWKCPNHADSLVKLRRKLKNQFDVDIDSTATENIPGDSHVEIVNIDDRIHTLKDQPGKLIYPIPTKVQILNNQLQLGNVTYKVKEEDIILDFIQGAKIRKSVSNDNILKNIDSNSRTYVESLIKLREKPVVNKEQKLHDLLNVIEDEMKIEPGGTDQISKSELRDLLIIKRLMEKKGKNELLNFLKL